ncbi:MAG: glycosyltransferase family 4 protein [Pseudomonadota bacterium]
MRILVLSFYYSPDLCAGSFRTTALVQALLELLPENSHIEVITTLPNRYSSFSNEAPDVEELPRLTIRRIKLPPHHSGMVDQSKAFVTYARQVSRLVRHGEYNLVYGTSSRLMTAVLSACVVRRKGLPLYLDIRDIFVDTIKDVLPSKMAVLAKPFFSLVERWTISRAQKVNLVSRGFEGYFTSRYPQQNYSYFTNGIDDEFLVAREAGSKTSKKSGQPLTILYAGNIGDGQGMHAIVPELAKRLEGRVRFRVIGDGGRKDRLKSRLREMGCVNVELLSPVKRDELLQEYRQADVLFLHLNNYPAFLKVLPSKLFEYAATGKPVWAGVAGYAAEFVRAEIKNAVVFPPCVVDEAVRVLGELKMEEVDRTEFNEKFARKNIVRNMAMDICSVLSNV